MWDVAASLVAAAEPKVKVRRMEHAKCRLRWQKIVHGLRFDLGSSLEHNVLHDLLDTKGRDTRNGRMTDIEG